MAGPLVPMAPGSTTATRGTRRHRTQATKATARAPATMRSLVTSTGSGAGLGPATPGSEETAGEHVELAPNAEAGGRGEQGQGGHEHAEGPRRGVFVEHEVQDRRDAGEGEPDRVGEPGRGGLLELARGPPSKRPHDAPVRVRVQVETAADERGPRQHRCNQREYLGPVQNEPDRERHTGDPLPEPRLSRVDHPDSVRSHGGHESYEGGRIQA